MEKNITTPRSIWSTNVEDNAKQNTARHFITDQTKLPFTRETIELKTMADAAHAIRSMQVRGAPLIGVTASYGVALMMNADTSDNALVDAINTLGATRPTAVNLKWALDKMHALLSVTPVTERCAAAWEATYQMAEADVETNRKIGEYGLAILQAMHQKYQRTINILTHCNAGALACVGYGTALAPIYLAHRAGLPVHVYVDETRPRNQGLLTALELREAGISHTYIVDNAGGHLMQKNRIDVVFVGADRISARGDAANKIGTYLKALAAADNNVAFYVAAPVSTLDPTIQDGLSEIEIEERDEMEVRTVCGVSTNNGSSSSSILMVDNSTPIANPGFDVTPARLITGIITERGVFAPANILDALLKD